MKKTLLVLLLMLLFGCKAKVVSVKTHSTDTIYKSEIIKITKLQLTELVIDNICDSLGNLKPFKITYGTKDNNTTLIGKDNIIYLEQNVDSIVNSKVNEYKSKNTSSEIIKVKTKTPKLFWYLLIYSILATVYIFRKFIPYLNMLPI